MLPLRARSLALGNTVMSSNNISLAGLRYILGSGLKNATTHHPQFFQAITEAWNPTTGVIAVYALKSLLTAGIISNLTLYGFQGVMHYYGVVAYLLLLAKLLSLCTCAGDGGPDGVSHCTLENFHNFELEHSILRLLHATVPGFQLRDGLGIPKTCEQTLADYRHSIRHTKYLALHEQLLRTRTKFLLVLFAVVAIQAYFYIKYVIRKDGYKSLDLAMPSAVSKTAA